MLVALIATAATWMGLTRDAQAQVLITPTGPLSMRTLALERKSTESVSKSDKFYPGRTMGGGPRILRSNPPPSSLKRREE
jgi:hypothetical protein